MKLIEGRDSRYKLLDLITLNEKEFHVSDMKPFVFDAVWTDPVARRDNMEYFIDTILQHRGNLNKRLNFSSIGLDMRKNNFWEPQKALCDTEQLHTYLIDQKLRYLIPQKFLNLI